MPANWSGPIRACSSMRVKMWRGRSPTSSANIQNTIRLTKWATSCGSWPRSRNRCAKRREGRRRALGEGLPALPGPQALGLGHRPLELVANRRFREIVQDELVRLADAVGPVGADAEARHVGDDQHRRVLQRERVLPELVERRVEIRVLALVLPGEAVPLPHVSPAVAAGVLARAALEAIVVAGRIGFGRRRLAQQPAQVDKVLLGRRALLQLRRAPLGDELACRHHFTYTMRRAGRAAAGCKPGRPCRTSLHLHDSLGPRCGLPLRIASELVPVRKLASG